MAALPSTSPYGAAPVRRTYARAKPAPSTGSLIAWFMVFLALGLMLGAAVGWMLFPIQWDYFLPHDTTQSRQFIIAVADKYWHTLDAVEAQNQLSRMDSDQVTELMTSILAETDSPETRTHVSALAQALDLSPTASPFAALLGHPLFLFAILFAFLPIAAGVWLVILPAMGERKIENERLAQEIVLTGGSMGSALNVDFTGSASTNNTGNGTGQKLTEAPGIDAAKQGGAPNSMDLSVNPTQATTLTPLERMPQDEDLEEEADEKQAEQKTIFQDLTSLFEEEDTSLSSLEAMVKNLPELNIDELSRSMRNLAKTLRIAISSSPQIARTE
jgi:hypothetical protein